MSESTNSPSADGSPVTAESKPSAFTIPGTPSVTGITNMLKRTLQVDTQAPAVPSQQPTTPGGTAIDCPIMGGLSVQGKHVIAHTGGKPLSDWSGLDPMDLEHSSTHAFTPKCLRDTSAKAAANFDGRRAGLYPTDAASKFKSGDDLDELCQQLLDEFTDWGMDTITYRADPMDSTQMVSVLEAYPHLNRENMAGHAAIQAKFDSYDKENDTAAKFYFLRSLHKDLAARIKQKINSSSSFVDLFLIFLNIELPSSSGYLDATEARVLKCKTSDFPGRNITLMCTKLRPLLNRLTKAQHWDSRKNVDLIQNFIDAPSHDSNREYVDPLHIMLTKAKKMAALIRCMSNKQKAEAMARAGLGWEDILDTAEEPYAEQTVVGACRWHYGCHKPDSATPPRSFANLSQLPSRGSFGPSSPYKKKQVKFKQKPVAKSKPKQDKPAHFAPPGPNDVPTSTLNSHPVYEREINGRKMYWCRFCKRWSTTHSSGGHTGKGGRSNPDSNRQSANHAVIGNVGNPQMWMASFSNVCQPCYCPPVKDEWIKAEDESVVAERFRRKPKVSKSSSKPSPVKLSTVNKSPSVRKSPSKPKNRSPSMNRSPSPSVAHSPTSESLFMPNLIGFFCIYLPLLLFENYTFVAQVFEWFRNITFGNVLDLLFTLESPALWTLLFFAIMFGRPILYFFDPKTAAEAQLPRYQRPVIRRYNNYVRKYRKKFRRVSAAIPMETKPRFFAKEQSHNPNWCKKRSIDRNIQKNKSYCPRILDLTSPCFYGQSDPNPKANSVFSRSECTCRYPDQKCKVECKSAPLSFVFQAEECFRGSNGIDIAFANPTACQSLLEQEDKFTIIWDSGASSCMTYNRSDFVGKIQPLKGHVSGISGALKVEGRGTVCWPVLDTSGKIRELKLPALYIPNSTQRLLSTTVFKQTYPRNAITLETNYWNTDCNPEDPSESALSVFVNPLTNLPTSMSYSHSKLPKLAANLSNTVSAVQHENFNLSEPQKEVLRWHQRLGHVCLRAIQFMMQSGILGATSTTQQLHRRAASLPAESLPKCAACQFGKQTNRAVPGRKTSIIRDRAGILSADKLHPGQKVFIDHFLCSTRGRTVKGHGIRNAGINKTSNGYCGGCIFVDASTGFTHVEFQTHLTAFDTIAAVKRFSEVAKNNGIIVQEYASDNGSAFTADEFRKYLTDNDIKITFSGAGSHHQNGKAEHGIRTVMAMARTMLLHAGIHWPAVADPTLWPLAVTHACWIYNHVPHISTGISPFDLWSKTRFPLKKLHDIHVWGCPIYVLDKRLADGKSIGRWKPRSQRCLYMGVSDSHASSVPWILNPETGTITAQWNVFFDDWFSTVSATDDSLPDFNQEEWSQLFGDATYHFDGDYTDELPPFGLQEEMVANDIKTSNVTPTVTPMTVQTTPATVSAPSTTTPATSHETPTTIPLFSGKLNLTFFSAHDFCRCEFKFRRR